jgi:RNA recognition motif-containing protein
MNSKRLFIQNLDHSTTAEHLENIFSTYGEVKVRKDMGFVEMMTASEANRVRNKLDGSNLWGRSMRIYTVDDTLRHRMFYLYNRFFR